MVLQGHVDDSPFTRDHRVEEDRLAIARHALGRPQRHVAQQASPTLAIPLDVDRDAHPPLGLAADQQPEQELQRGQGVAVAAGQDAHELAADAELDARQTLVELRRVQADLRGNLHPLEQVDQHLACHIADRLSLRVEAMLPNWGGGRYGCGAAWWTDGLGLVATITRWGDLVLQLLVA